MAFKNFQNAQGGLSSALSRLMVVSERYPELKSPDQPTAVTPQAVAERFIIGTFISVLWAVTCAGLVRS